VHQTAGELVQSALASQHKRQLVQSVPAGASGDLKMARKTHNYNGWHIVSCARAQWLAERQSDNHIAPQYYSTLRAAKAAIDDGSAALTAKQRDVQRNMALWRNEPSADLRAQLVDGWRKIADFGNLYRSGVAQAMLDAIAELAE
jgi:hypothetical protein